MLAEPPRPLCFAFDCNPVTVGLGRVVAQRILAQHAGRRFDPQMRAGGKGQQGQALRMPQFKSLYALSGRRGLGDLQNVLRHDGANAEDRRGNCRHAVGAAS